MKQRFFSFLVVVSFFCAVALTAVLPGCSHNFGVLGTGTRITADQSGIGYTDGLFIADLGRENSSWELEVDSATGVEYDAKSGTIKGVQKIKRTIGPQITGYLVDLAKASPEMAAMYLKYYTENSHVAPLAETAVSASVSVVAADEITTATDEAGNIWVIVGGAVAGALGLGGSSLVAYKLLKRKDDEEATEEVTAPESSQ